MENKVVIVTGSSGNLGQAVVRKFLSGKFKVVGNVRSRGKERVKIDHPDYDERVADLTDENAAGRFIEAVAAKYGHIDVAVCTVGGFTAGTIGDTSTTDIRDQYRLNFETLYNVARPVFQQMMRQGRGRIFFIGSRAGWNTRDGKGMVAYSLSKSLVFRLAELINEESKGHEVEAVVVVPSILDTPQNRKSMPEADYKKWVPADAVAEVIFSYCTGPASLIREPVVKVYGDS